MLHVHKTELCVLMTVSQITCKQQIIVCTRERIQGNTREQRRKNNDTSLFRAILRLRFKVEQELKQYNTCGWFCVCSFQKSGCMKLFLTLRQNRSRSRAPHGMAGSWFPSMFSSRKFLRRRNIWDKSTLLLLRLTSTTKKSQ